MLCAPVVVIVVIVVAVWKMRGARRDPIKGFTPILLSITTIPSLPLSGDIQRISGDKGWWHAENQRWQIMNCINCLKTGQEGIYRPLLDPIVHHDNPFSSHGDMQRNQRWQIKNYSNCVQITVCTENLITEALVFLTNWN